MVNKALDFKLEGSNIVLAGAFKGVGLELAKLLVSCKSNVLIIGRTKENGLAAIKDLNNINSLSKINFETYDLYKRRDRISMVENIRERFPKGINHLVSFIGTGKTDFGVNVDVENWKDIFDKNFFSVIDLINLCLPSLKKENKNNSIIITSAIAGLERLSAPQSYSCSKAALSSYIPHLASELAQYNIRVIGINPGNIYFKNGRWEEIIQEKGIKEIEKNILNNVSMKRFGLAEEISWTYLMALSPRNSFMTGNNLVVDGQQINKTI